MGVLLVNVVLIDAYQSWDAKVVADAENSLQVMDT
jgi:hypothetical protein